MSALFDVPITEALASIKPDVRLSTLCIILVVGLLAVTRSFAAKGKPWIRVGRSPGPLGLNSIAARMDFFKQGRAIVRGGYNKVLKYTLFQSRMIMEKDHFAHLCHPQCSTRARTLSYRRRKRSSW